MQPAGSTTAQSDPTTAEGGRPQPDEGGRRGLDSKDGQSPGKPLRLLLLARDQSTWVQDALAKVQSVLATRPEITVVGTATTHDPTPDEREVDFALVLGGDGAILRAARFFGHRPVPLLGVNLGRLGFLADLSMDDLEEHLDAIVSRDFQTARHLMLTATIRRPNESPQEHLIVNELVITSGPLHSMVDVELSVDGQLATTYSGDGLILSTPVGSTAHSLSAGGPILRQNLDAVVITPICSHALTVRPVVDCPNRRYRLVVPDASPGTMIVIDGQVREELGREDVVEVTRANVSFELIRLAGHSYYDTLQRKLGWAGQPRYRRLRREALAGNAEEPPDRREQAGNAD